MKKVQSVRAVDQVIHTLRQQILDGEYSIGTRLQLKNFIYRLGSIDLLSRGDQSWKQRTSTSTTGQGVTVCDFHQTASLEVLRTFPRQTSL